MARSHHSLQIGENHTVPNIIIAAGKGCSTSYTSRTIVNLETAEVNNICRPGEPDTSALQGTPDKSCNFKSRRIDIEHCFSVLLCTLQLQVLMVRAHFTYSHFTYSHSPTLSFHSPTLISPTLISPTLIRLLSFRLLSFHLHSFCLLSFRLLSFRLLSFRLLSFHLLSFRLLSFAYSLISPTLIRLLSHFTYTHFAYSHFTYSHFAYSHFTYSHFTYSHSPTNAPINGLQYAPSGADVGERRGICRQNLPRGVGTGLSHPNTYISPCHTLSTTGRYGGGWYAVLCPRHGGLFHSVGHVNSPPISHRAPRYWK